MSVTLATMRTPFCYQYREAENGRAHFVHMPLHKKTEEADARKRVRQLAKRFSWQRVRFFNLNTMEVTRP